MPKPVILFLPSKYTHWEMYLPLVSPLAQAGIDVRFVLLKDFFQNYKIPEFVNLQTLSVWSPALGHQSFCNNKIKVLYVALTRLLPRWKQFLAKLGKGAVVVAQDGGPIQRLLLNVGAELGFKRVTMQDGYFVSIPRSYGWSLEGGYKVHLKKLIIKTPLEKLITRGFGVASDHCGLYGNITRKRLCDNHVIPWSKATVIGSTRHALFRTRVAALGDNHDDREFRVLCLPSTFPAYRDKLLEDSQNKALNWVIEGSIDSCRSARRTPIVSIKVKRGYDHLIQYYRRLFELPEVKILEGHSNLEELFSRSDLVATMGSTAALEAAVSNKPIIQVFPAYLHARYISISGLPIAGEYREVKEFVGRALDSPADLLDHFSFQAREELADIDPVWDSIKQTTNWLLEIVEGNYRVYSAGRAKEILSETPSQIPS